MSITREERARLLGEDHPLHPLHVVEALVEFVAPRLPTCDRCGERDPSVSGGRDVGGVARPDLCGACRCDHRFGDGHLHDYDCRESPDYCAGCVGLEHGIEGVPHHAECLATTEGT